MLQHCLKATSRVRGMLTALIVLVHPASAGAGAAGGAATEWTQLANNAQLVELLKSSGIQVDNQLTQITQLTEQIQNQLRIYENMLQNTAPLPSHVWGQIERDLNGLRETVKLGQGIAFSMGHADDVLQQRFRSFAELETDLSDGKSYSRAYQTWSDTNRDTIASTLRVAGLTARQFDDEEDAMSSLRSMSQSADGQMKALQIGHQIAAQQVQQMQKLRGLVSQQMVMMGTWLQSQQTDKDLAQKRREGFFQGTAPPTSGGKKMEVEW